MSSAQDYPRDPERPVSRWASGAIVFAATVMVMIGFFQVVAGIVAIFDDEFYVVTRNYTFDLDVSAWGWAHLILGAIILATGFGLFAGSAWAGVTAIVVLSISAIANFFFIPYYPIWSLVVIGLDIWVIWALTRPGALQA